MPLGHADSDEATIGVADEVGSVAEAGEDGLDDLDVVEERERLAVGPRARSARAQQIGDDGAEPVADQSGLEPAPLPPGHAAAVEQNHRRACAFILDVDPVRAPLQRLEPRLIHGCVSIPGDIGAHAHNVQPPGSTRREERLGLACLPARGPTGGFVFEDEAGGGSVVAAVDAVLAQSTRAAVVASVAGSATMLADRCLHALRCRRPDPRRAAMKRCGMERRRPSSPRGQALFVLLDRRAVYPAIGCAGRI